MAKTEGTKRKLKPVIEKKRRDRINHNLDALRDLLFKNTADTRLQNPKLEKAEILDLAVHYIKKTTRKTETKVMSNQMDSKTTPNKSDIRLISVSAGPMNANDFYWKQKEVLLKVGISLDDNLTDASKAGNQPVVQTGFLLSPSTQNLHQELLLHPESSFYGSKLLCQSTSPTSSSSQYSSPPSSPTFFSVSSSSPKNFPAHPFTSCSLPPPPDPLSPLITPLSLHRPVIVSQPILPHMARDCTPPQSPVLALRQEPFPLSTQSTWRPWS
ncbi:hairy-related 11 isoform X2 [Pimephales promelas]|uniref:hairy-related 11 isoform X2 n=1 Tax=Pimephales promelas TaxID=90988 RepID=UPI001955DF91|nr:hairy-related 11 isoform X2 [Pimephales promelas]